MYSHGTQLAGKIETFLFLDCVADVVLRIKKKMFYFSNNVVVIVVSSVNGSQARLTAILWNVSVDQAQVPSLLDHFHGVLEGG